MPWYKFDSQESFDLWHNSIKSKLGYPIPSIDQDGNEIGEPYTIEYTTVIQVSDSDFRAVIEIEHSEGLIESQSPFQRPNYDQTNA